MSLTVIQRFYNLAKEKPEKAALGFNFEGNYHDLPWWILKSKAKHFCLGLLEEGAKPGEYFYLFPCYHPNRIYSEIGGLTVGLQILPLPKNIGLESLKDLFKQFPPTFIFMEGPPPQEWQRLIEQEKNLKKIIYSEESWRNRIASDLPATSFRQVFNLGIQKESSHYMQYRKLRDELQPSMIMSPIHIDNNYSVQKSPLFFSHVDQLASQLTEITSPKKERKIFVDADLSLTHPRIVSLYWPIYHGFQTIHNDPQINLSAQLRTTRPEMAFFVEPNFSETLSPLLSEGKNSSSNPLNKFIQRYKFRKTLGKKLRKILTWSPLEPSLQEKFNKGGIQVQSLGDILTLNKKENE